MANQGEEFKAMREHEVTTMLTQLQQLFPQYHTDHDMLAQAGLCVATMLGSLGAWALHHGGEQRLDKFLHMVLKNAEHMAHEGKRVIDERVRTADVDPDVRRRRH